MEYDLLSIVPSGNGKDFVLRVNRRPSWYEEIWGVGGGPTAFQGPRPEWVRMDGQAATRREQRALDRIWYERKAPTTVDNPWQMVEPEGDMLNRQMKRRAAGLPPDTNRKIAGATGEPLRQ